MLSMSDKSIHTSNKIIPLDYFILDSFLKTNFSQQALVCRQHIPGMELAFPLPFTVNLSLLSFYRVPRWSALKTLPANAGGATNAGSVPGWGRFPWSRKWQPTPVFLPGKSHGQRIQAGSSSWGHSQTWLSNWAQNSTSNIFHPHYYLFLYLLTSVSLTWFDWFDTPCSSKILLLYYFTNIYITYNSNILWQFLKVWYACYLHPNCLH